MSVSQTIFSIYVYICRIQKYFIRNTITVEMFFYYYFSIYDDDKKKIMKNMYLYLKHSYIYIKMKNEILKSTEEKIHSMCAIP